jgi:predicted heme/steroid binding protein
MLKCIFAITSVFLALFFFTPAAQAAEPEPVPLPAGLAPSEELLYLNGHTIGGAFRTFFLANGGEAQFGVPTSEALLDPASGLTVQYFSYARFELHNDSVELTRLGSVYGVDQSDTEPFTWQAQPAELEPGRVYIAESGHTLGGAFAWFYDQHGGAVLIGYPISEEFNEVQPDGSELLVQYFERAHLSYHPAEAGTTREVQRLELGTLAAETQLTPEQRAPVAAPPAAPTVLKSASLTYTPGSKAGHNIELAAARLHGSQAEAGQTLSFLGSIGEVSAASGYVNASGIVNGEISDNVVGGGICDVSTVLYRAAWNAGLPVRERHNHTYWFRHYADQPGLEAAVFEGVIDLRLVNDTANTLYVAARAQGGLLTITLWGDDDGRSTTSTVSAPNYHTGSAKVVNSREIYRGDGSFVRSETVVTRYQARPEPAEEVEEEEPAPASDPAPQSGPKPV